MPDTNYIFMVSITFNSGFIFEIILSQIIDIYIDENFPDLSGIPDFLFARLFFWIWSLSH